MPFQRSAGAERHHGHAVGNAEADDFCHFRRGFGPDDAVGREQHGVAFAMPVLLTQGGVGGKALPETGGKFSKGSIQVHGEGMLRYRGSLRYW